MFCPSPSSIFPLYYFTTPKSSLQDRFLPQKFIMESNLNERPSFDDLTNLNIEKLQEMETVITSVLALPAARDTYSSILLFVIRRLRPPSPSLSCSILLLYFVQLWPPTITEIMCTDLTDPSALRWLDHRKNQALCQWICSLEILTSIILKVGKSWKSRWQQSWKWHGSSFCRTRSITRFCAVLYSQCSLRHMSQGHHVPILEPSCW